MTNDQMRIAIAEACGWKLSVPHFGHDGKWRRTAYTGIDYHDESHSAWAGPPIDVISDWSNTPNYPTDLNAMHEAEKFLTPLKLQDYAWELSMLMADESFILTASAIKRGEAFLRTIGKWKD